MTDETLLCLTPPAILIVSACAVLAGSSNRRFIIPPQLLPWWGVASFTLAALLLILISREAGGADVQEISLDHNGILTQCLFLLLGGLTAATARVSDDSAEKTAFRVAMLMLSVAGGFIAAMAADLLLLLIALQMAGLPLALLLPQGERKGLAGEALLKFLLMGGLSCGLIVFGMALIAVEAGTLNLTAMRLEETVLDDSPRVITAVVLLICGLAIPLAAAPFHLAAIDVIDAVDKWTAGLLLWAPRLTAAVALLRLIELPLSPRGRETGTILFAVFAVMSLLGGLPALRQTRIARQCAYLSVAQSGFWLLGLGLCCAAAGGATLGPFAHANLIAHLYTSTLALLGLTMGLQSLTTANRPYEYLEELSGLARKQPWLAAAIAMSLLSLVGIPPTLGFWSQAGLLWRAIASGPSLRVLQIVAVVSVIGSVAVAAGAIRLCELMFLSQPLSKPVSGKLGPAKLVAFGLAAAILGLGFLPDWLWSWLSGS